MSFCMEIPWESLIVYIHSLILLCFVIIITRKRSLNEYQGNRITWKFSSKNVFCLSRLNYEMGVLNLTNNWDSKYHQQKQHAELLIEDHHPSCLKRSVYIISSFYKVIRIIYIYFFSSNFLFLKKIKMKLLWQSKTKFHIYIKSNLVLK